MLGGVCAVPSAILKRDITIIILTKEVIINKIDGNRVIVVTSARISKDRLYRVLWAPVAAVMAGNPWAKASVKNPNVRKKAKIIEGVEIFFIFLLSVHTK